MPSLFVQQEVIYLATTWGSKGITVLRKVRHLSIGGNRQAHISLLLLGAN